jgi:hypothetical protein
MADFKKVALAIGIMILLPLFLFLFLDAVYPSPEYNDYCTVERSLAQKAVPESCRGSPSELECTVKGRGVNGTQIFDCKSNTFESRCADVYSTAEVQACSQDEGMPEFTMNNACCQVYESCNYCQRDYNDATQMHNRNLFFILAPIGLVLIILGIYLAIDYMAAGLMFAGLITLIWATVIYFSEMTKIGRALVILVELLIIMWLGYKKIGNKQIAPSNARTVRRKR